MSRTRAAIVLTLMLGSAAPRQPDDLRHAVALRGCTQEDARALEVYLTRERHDGAGEPAAPYVRLEVVWGAWEQAAGRALELVPLVRRDAERQKPVVRAELHSGPDAPEWLLGTLLLRRVDVGRRVVGAYEFVRPDGRRWTGTFRARWVASRGGCG